MSLNQSLLLNLAKIHKLIMPNSVSNSSVARGESGAGLVDIRAFFKLGWLSAGLRGKGAKGKGKGRGKGKERAKRRRSHSEVWFSSRSIDSVHYGVLVF